MTCVLPFQLSSKAAKLPSCRSPTAHAILSVMEKVLPCIPGVQTSSYVFPATSLGLTVLGENFAYVTGVCLFGWLAGWFFV